MELVREWPHRFRENLKLVDLYRELANMGLNTVPSTPTKSPISIC
ncbi:hypothetical protein NBRC111894_4573 [Sporolactobacillus inulinus]|uniref:Uncharacterized protein n=1 Tax=Sporolactobacillus inulinus TaxID=2078 RepID=A0A4Y1ZJ16_9BACL|nr:hypothetical protein NBRC111894_4573 [Sporolactobacillus inulinus]